MSMFSHYKYLWYKLLPLFMLSTIILSSCQKDDADNQVSIQPIDKSKDLSIIFLMGDGMGVAQLTAAWHSNHYLQMENFPYAALVRTQAANRFVTGSAASATAMMCGQKTNLGFLGIDTQQQPLQTLYEYLKTKGYQTGIISSSMITDASPAALYTHRPNRKNYEAIALDFYYNPPDIAYGGGNTHFTDRTDGKQLLDSLAQKGFQIYDNANNITEVASLPLVCFPYPLYPPMLLDGRPQDMEIATKKALSLLEPPFFLFVEGGLIDHGGHNTNIDEQVSETLEFDQLCGYALQYANTHKNVLVLVTADHECGGLSLLKNESDDMTYTPHYAIDEHSGDMVPLFAAGTGAHLFTGMIDNTEIHQRILQALGN